jgi:hypothetical protein
MAQQLTGALAAWDGAATCALRGRVGRSLLVGGSCGGRVAEEALLRGVRPIDVADLFDMESSIRWNFLFVVLNA